MPEEQKPENQATLKYSYAADDYQGLLADLAACELEQGRLKQNVASFTQAAFNQKDRADDAEEQVRVLREALEAVEWAPRAVVGNGCMSCHAVRKHGHKDDCQLDAALAATAPSSPAEEAKR